MDIGFGKKKDEKENSLQATDNGGLRGKMRKMEQTIDSLNKRLDAIERRLSNEEFEGPATMVPKGEQSQNGANRMHQPSKKIESKIIQLQQELQEIKKESAEPSKKDEAEKQHEGSPTVLKPGSEKERVDNNINSRTMADLERRMEDLEERKATIKVGRIDVPIEITGVVGGGLAFLIAALLLQGYRELIISPAFVTFLGVVLVLAAACKTYLINQARQ